MLIVISARYQSLQALPMSNNCTKFTFVKKQLRFVFYQRKDCVNNKNSFENFFIKCRC